MQNWYKKPATKAILFLLAHIMAVTAVLSVAVLLTFSSSTDFMESGKTYEESKSFESLVSRTSWDVMEGIAMKNNFESEGKYNPDKLVDIISLSKNGTISGENVHGLAYELQDLVNWSSEYMTDGANYEEANIAVCERTDGTYYYYYMNEFLTMFRNGKLKLEIQDIEPETFLSDLQNGNYTSGYYNGLTIRNIDGETEYINCWSFNEPLKEKYTPVGAGGILEVVNKTPELNGKLSKVYEYMQNVLGSISVQVDRYLYTADTWDEGNTNFTYMFVDEHAKKVYTNNSKYKDYDSVKASLEQMKSGKNQKFLIVKPKLSEFESNMNISASEWRSMVKSYKYSEQIDCIFAASVDTKFPIQDVFYSAAKTYNTYAPYLRMAMVGGSICSILFLVILIWLTLIAGRNGAGDEIHLNTFDKWKTEIGAAMVLAVWIFPSIFVGTVWPRNTSVSNTMYNVDGTNTSLMSASHSYYTITNISLPEFILIGILTAFTTACFLFGYLSLVRRIKAKTLWKNSILRSLGSFLKEFWLNRTVTFKAAVVLAGFILIHWIAMFANDGGLLTLMMMAAEAGAFYYIVRTAIAKQKIKTGIKEIASGNVNYQIPLEHLKGDNLQMAEMINNIGNGLQRAVEEGMKSERLKTDLITNVSHDIKTPLTSIINYVDILKRQKFDDPKIQGYLDVLESKAQRLKTLTEDVVEASKVSSGNITLELMDVNLVEMLNQTAGEFEEKFGAKGLLMVQKLPDEPAIIHVDGRRMWRVLENIYNNAAKYAMPGTRVYADLWLDKDSVGFSLKNISEQPLNISADELTERFIRGDISRGTEGSGLGLSIAKSLTHMQGGDFRLYLDGDLFKVTIEFPRVK